MNVACKKLLPERLINTMISENIIEARKLFGRIWNNGKRKAKLDRCLWCGKPISHFCESHTIPQMILRNISQDGKLDYVNTILQNPLKNTDQGIAEAGVIYLICNECDNTLFQEYENLERLKQVPTERMLALIALKDLLLILYKRLVEIKVYDQTESKTPSSFWKRKQLFNYLDKRDFLLEYERIWQMFETDKFNYELISWDKVNYKVPVAFQGPLTIYGDMNGDLVIDIYDDSPTQTIKQMHMCVFPLQTDCSVIFTFKNKDDREYDTFATQLQNMEQEKKLKFLGYLMFFISEDMKISKNIPHKTYFYEQTRNMFMDNYEIWCESQEEYEYLKKRNLNRFKDWRDDCFPAILTEKYKLKD